MIQKKGQAAMEFLMTYGWALLVVLIAIGALYFYGILQFESPKDTEKTYLQFIRDNYENKTWIDDLYFFCRYEGFDDIMVVPVKNMRYLIGGYNSITEAYCIDEEKGIALKVFSVCVNNYTYAFKEGEYCRFGKTEQEAEEALALSLYEVQKP